MPKKTTKNSDRPLQADEAGEIRASIGRAYAHLKLKPSASATHVQEAMRDAIDAVTLGKKKLPMKAREGFAFDLGCLWGQIVCDALGWQWCVATVDGDEFIGVAPANRSHIVPVLNFICTQIEKRPPEENTSLLLFNMLKEGSFGKAKAASYIPIG
jgi:hypothetical protein